MNTTSVSTTTQPLLDRIYSHIVSQPVDDQTSLLGGQIGFAILEAYYQHFHGITTESRTWERIAHSLATIQQGELTYPFASGIAGVAWGFLHLFNHGLVQDDDLDPNEIVEDLDEPLFEVAKNELSAGNYDYLHGGLGVCLYFLERRPSEAIARFVDALVEQLSGCAVRFTDGGISWRFDNFGQHTPTDPPVYNVGLSHGTASIVALLSLLYERGYARARCASLIQGSLQWMWANRNQSGLSIFPNTIQAVRSDQHSRLGWCYGDLGIANAFWLAGEKLAVPEWQMIAIRTVQQAAGRREPDDTLITDASLCHGAAGAAYLFRRFSARQPQPLLDEAARFWLDKLPHYASPDDRPDVFLTYHKGQYEPNLSLLDGEAGIGMALLSELGGQTYWDRFLLLS
ncbi:Subtilin biosynthesis protein spaC [Fibrisoma limi BUZ 3]|uniref:Subtilin biosynthesis protein spaC n=1 Tax=Fibrisoma limi BUZ 3 TaxID=1185876 RepID=I2GB85_9BACT|nr:lanthionine synthetase C family protein [Fibrisoma limi]CCH51159.1 Subtilin biosynthesis protein spaC [Fibrisoma limi BUZ 3]